MANGRRLVATVGVLISVAWCAAPVRAAAPADRSPPAQLVSLFDEWRQVAAPSMREGAPDFGAAALARKAAELAQMRQRLAALPRGGWSPHVVADARLIEAEMNGLDFDLRVRRPWARDPSFYATVFGEESDVPAHEGPAADTIDLFRYDWPLSATDARKLKSRLDGVPVLLQRARVSLADGQGADLWQYGGRALDEQTAVLDALIAGTLSMRTLDGKRKATLADAPPALRVSVIAARDATRAFAGWVKAQAPGKTGPSGVGKTEYDWYMRHVQLVPYDWDAQVALLERELHRAWSGLRLEEQRNRSLPPLAEIADPVGYRRFAETKMAGYTDFLVANGFLADKPYYRAALAAQTLDFVPLAERNFFYHVVALDPWPLYAHGIHWMELARIRHEPNADPIRRVAPLYNIFQSRSEGFATAFEEIVMQAGLYDDVPRARELVWIMLANRAARGLASLRVQANQWNLAEAGRFHARWTPRGYSDPANALVGFEQLLYLRQPGYGTSYITGKIELDGLIARTAQADEHQPYGAVIRQVMETLSGEGTVPFALYPGQADGAPAGANARAQ